MQAQRLLHSLQHSVPSSKSDACNPKKTNSKVPSIAIWLPILWIPACMNRPLKPWWAEFQLPQIIGESGYEKTQETGWEAKTIWDHQPKPSQLGNPRGKSSKSLMFQAQFWAKLRGNIWVVRPSGFVMESTAEDFGAKISEPWGKDGKGLSKTGCNWQTPRMFGLLPNNIGYTSGILTKHRYYGYILGIPAGTYPLVYFYFDGRDVVIGAVGLVHQE